MRSALLSQFSAAREIKRPMDVLKGIEGYNRKLMLSHAIRHLLNHKVSETMFGDVAAIDILQTRMNDERPDIAADSTSLAEDPPALFGRTQSIPECKEQPDGDFLVLSSGHEQRVLGKIAIEGAALRQVLEKSPLSLTSLLEALLRALDSPVSEKTKYAPTQTEAVEQRA